ncbi:hypothetical protein ACFY0N_31050 [Streptomyces vinaceus]|uniref:hypothetical protein n=1 Tax=Streptomyces vinaceus TaxID=1960 RepID=UPI00369609B1
MITAHWFLKAAEHHLPSRVWLDPEEAVIWLKGVYAENLPIEGPELTYVDLDSKIAHALEVLPLGQDVSWVYYLPGKRIVSYSVVCCPNRVHPEIPCPLPPA